MRRGDPVSGPAESLWTKTRSGARAGRGFHYQDAVGAWLCGRVLSGRLAIDRIVPEGFEDLSCEGPISWHVQVKSRQERVGDFTAADVAGHLVAMAKAHAERAAAGVTDRAILVLERPVAGELFTHWDRPLSVLPTGHPVLREFATKAAHAGLNRDEIDAWCEGSACTCCHGAPRQRKPGPRWYSASGCFLLPLNLLCWPCATKWQAKRMPTQRQI